MMPRTKHVRCRTKTCRWEQQTMKLGFFTMPIHPLDKDWRLSLKEDREAFLLADELDFTEAYVGEHITDKAENITSCIAFIAWLAAATKQIKLGTGTVNMPNAQPPPDARSASAPAGCCRTLKSSAISKRTGTRCSWKPSI